MVKKHLLLIIGLCIGLLGKLSAQAPANSLGGYANVDNNFYKIPKFIIGVSGIAEYGPGIGIRAGAHLKYRNEKFGELQINGTFTPSPLVTIPEKPFGPTYKCNCSENNFNPFTEIEGSYTYYFRKRESGQNYRVYLNTKPSISVYPKPGLSFGEYENLPGKKKYFLGARFGAAFQSGNLYLLSQQRMLAYTGQEQLVAFLGLSHTTIGRMYKNFDQYGIKGKNLHYQFYADAFYAANQTHTVTPVAIYDAAGNLKKEEVKTIPYGARVGFINYHFGYRSRFAWYTGIEIGARPTFDHYSNGIYANVKIGIGFGTGNAPVQYTSKHQQELNSRDPNLKGNGKYRKRKGFDRKIHKNKPLKLIKHRYGK